MRHSRIDEIGEIMESTVKVALLQESTCNLQTQMVPSDRIMVSKPVHI